MKIPNNKKTQNISSDFEECFSQISPEIAVTFTKEQIEAIQKGFSHREWKQHSLDLRISVPIPLIRFYLVLLAGEERRSKQRWQYEKQLYPFWTFGNILFLMALSFIFIVGSISTLFLMKSLIPKQSNSIFPTSLPWIQNETQCKRANKNWSDDRCWDSEHNPTF
ncbi:hypothetical protein VB713_21960 [Anabaena cylindrica UHCC 0172]|uniref:hypothetical protein n=1 Tax=Anabaena cylindrica TaxID=1165 RepID=UPI002B20D9BF|nr:hypothetical protein [Anabaena cylindrica]MEA5553607.1 hypothetical protein [Anabaena cylindrica UHCC 0172]